MRAMGIEAFGGSDHIQLLELPVPMGAADTVYHRISVVERFEGCALASCDHGDQLVIRSTVAYSGS